MANLATAPAPCGIAVMAKASKAGRTKTRLCPPLRGEEAAAFNTAFLKDVAANIVDAADLAPIAGYMAFGPPGEAAFFDFLPTGFGLFEAWRPTFGACLSDTIAELFARGHKAAGVLNADSPTLPPVFLAEAADALARDGDRAVLGPSSDGGYYFLGLKQHHTRLFEEITWSTDVVAAQTLERAAEIGLSVHVLPTWYDVDDEAALTLLDRELFANRSFNATAARLGAAHHSRALIAALKDNGRWDAVIAAGTAEYSAG